MNSARPLFAALVVAFFFTGCFQDEKVLKLKADGSGTIEETVVLGKIALQQMRQLLAGSGSVAQSVSIDLLEEARLKEGASQWGEGVTLVSAREITTPLGQGYKAVYAFADINQLKLNLNPGSALPPTSRLRPKDDGKKQEPVTFRFQKGPLATLAIIPPPPGVEVKQNGAEVAPEALAQMMQLMQDMKMSFAIEVSGKIQETNAQYPDGRRATLLNLDMNKLLAAPDRLRTFLNAQPQSLPEAKELLKGVPGMQVESSPEVTITFR
jgi:hypothetical protein